MIIITINFIIFTSLWFKIAMERVTIGISTESDNLQICTLYSNDNIDNLTFYDQIWPTLFGGQDFIVGIITLIIFVKKIINISKNPGLNDIETETLIRKLCILGSLAICSTFIFYTFAVPLYPNLTFLLPFDAILNSLCIVLLLDYSARIYHKVCCICDKALIRTLKHQNVTQAALVGMFCFFNVLTSFSGLQFNHFLDINKLNHFWNFLCSIDHE